MTLSLVWFFISKKLLLHSPYLIHPIPDLPFIDFDESPIRIDKFLFFFNTFNDRLLDFERWKGDSEFSNLISIKVLKYCSSRLIIMFFLHRHKCKICKFSYYS